jgi:YegS/Rv2252/BmrU family lipid kinase
MARIAFIMNPIAGTRNKEAAWAYIGQVFGLSPDYELTMYTTACADDGYARALQFAREGYDAVVAVGGDGTVNEVARGLLHSNTALGIIPMGSGNGLARHLRLPLNFRKAIEVIRSGNVQPIDAAEINGRTFFCTAGVGFDALIGNLFNQRGKRGMYNYIGLSMRKMPGYAPREYLINIDGTPLRRKAFLITVANASQWGNNAYIAPKADISDGWLDVVILNEYSMIEVPLLLPRLFTRSIHKAWTSEALRGRSIRIVRAREDYVHYDGESSIMGKALDIHVIPLALKVIIPPIMSNG